MSKNTIVGQGPARSGKAAPNAEEQYWTEERMANAIPVPLPTEPKKDQLGKAAAPAGPAGHTQAAHGKEAAPGEHDKGAVPAPLTYPYRTCGKLFFTQKGSDYAGSASLVAPHLLLTAGHCVFDGGAWSTNVAFYPSYPSRASSDANYRFTYNYVAAWTAWTQHGDRAYDYGMVWLNAAPGNSLGWLGMLWNASTNGRTWEAVGYPATPSPPYNGQVMDNAVGTFQSSSTSGTIGLTHDNMEHGSSGGPWITNWNGSAREYANGLQSFHIHDGDFVEYGPYFTQDVKGLYDWISNPANRH